MDLKTIQGIVGVTQDGIMGPKTQAAIKAWQSAHGLTPDGIVGPKTTAAMQASSSSANMSKPTTTTIYSSTGAPMSAPITTPTTTTKATTTKPTTTPTTPTTPTKSTTPTTLTTNATQISSQAALLGAIADVATSTYSTKNSGLTLDEALTAAQNDPNLMAKYSDTLKMDTAQFQQFIQQTQAASTLESKQYQTQFENERKALAQQHASAGTAYSGFRGRAQEQLEQQESGIVQSSQAALKKSMQDATQAFEAKYGTSATTPVSVQYTNPFGSAGTSISGLNTPGNTSIQKEAGQTIGGIMGSQPLAQKADVLSKGTDLYNVGQLPKM